MRTLSPLSLQRVTHRDPVVYSNEERYRMFRDRLPVMLGNSLFDFSERRPTVTPQRVPPVQAAWRELDNAAA